MENGEWRVNVIRFTAKQKSVNTVGGTSFQLPTQGQIFDRNYITECE